MKPEEYLKQPYARILIPEAAGGFSAEILEFPGCFSQGKTAEEAFHNLENAALAWIESAIKHGQDIPAPSAHHGYPGKIALRLPRSIHRKAAQFAEREGTSLNQFLVSAISARVGAEDLYSRLIEKFQERRSQVVRATTASFGFHKMTLVSSAPKGRVVELGAAPALSWGKGVVHLMASAITPWAPQCFVDTTSTGAWPPIISLPEAKDLE